MQIQERGLGTHAGQPVAVTRAPTWLIALTVVLAVALVALGAWVIVDRSGSETLPADEVATNAPALARGVGHGDSDAILDLYAETRPSRTDATWWAPKRSRTTSKSSMDAASWPRP